MPPATHPPSAYGREPSLRRRIVSFLISVLVNLLILWVLLRLAPAIQGVPGGKGRTMSFNISPDDAQSTEAHRARAAAKAASAAPPHPSVTAPTPIKPPPIPLPPQPLSPLIIISPQEFQRSDISKMPSQAQAQAAQPGTGSASSGSADGDSELASGSGPNGEPLYRAEWYREPTDAELRFYMPKRGVALGSWAEIACQTLPRFHVDNCVPLADSPPGSGLARAIQQAGWQFLVRPPRVGGKALVGSWVRIRISFTRQAKDEDAGG
ncbi:hypothetical protein [Sphingomonas bacterium]|uniref:hypothetical protein n=1 Tax=Sphingomonas bacterium TaxID=1895847 RepID=UPI0015777B66|nr:hypothetical protein [Sphingomonas bacterium]